MRQDAHADRAGELAALRDFFAYNTFVRRRYLSFLTGQPKAALEKDRGASFPSLIDIHTHILDVYRRWFHWYETGEDSPELKGLSVPQLKELEREVDGEIDDFMRRLTADDLSKSFRFNWRKGSSKGTLTRNTGEMLWHLIEEELQHRGELNALLWQDDIDPPVTGWFRWKRVTRQRGRAKA